MPAPPSASPWGSSRLSLLLRPHFGSSRTARTPSRSQIGFPAPLPVGAERRTLGLCPSAPPRLSHCPLVTSPFRGCDLARDKVCRFLLCSHPRPGTPPRQAFSTCWSQATALCPLSVLVPSYPGSPFTCPTYPPDGMGDGRAVGVETLHYPLGRPLLPVPPHTGLVPSSHLARGQGHSRGPHFSTKGAPPSDVQTLSPQRDLAGPRHYFQKTEPVWGSPSHQRPKHPTSRTKNAGLYAKILLGCTWVQDLTSAHPTRGPPAPRDHSWPDSRGDPCVGSQT